MGALDIENVNITTLAVFYFIVCAYGEFLLTTDGGYCIMEQSFYRGGRYGLFRFRFLFYFLARASLGTFVLFLIY